MLLLGLASLVAAADSVAYGQPPVDSPFSGESLRQTKITVTVQNQSFREVLENLLHSVNLGAQGNSEDVSDDPMNGHSLWSLWLDRRVDPSQTINVTAAATPAAEVIIKVIDPIGLVAYPLPGVLLVGRREWVESTLANLPPTVKPKSTRESGQSDQQDVISIKWADGATAAEVLAMAVLNQAEPDSKKVPDWLPHDVWRGGSLTRVDRTLATALVLAQFDLRLRRTTSLLPLLTTSTATDLRKADSLGSTPASDRATMPIELPSMVTRGDESSGDATTGDNEFNQSYPGGKSAAAIRQAIRRDQIRAHVRGTKEGLNIRANAATHIDLVRELWLVALEPSSKAAESERSATEPVFDLKLVNKPVREVLSQFAAAAGKTIQFDPGTELAAERLVSLDANKKTLHQLADEVAGQVGLKIVWDDERVVVTRP